MCLSDPVLARVHNRAPGFRPALFYSPYEAAVWSIISARRPAVRESRCGTDCRSCMAPTSSCQASAPCVPTPSGLLEMGSMPGMPADRIPRLHAVAEAAQRGAIGRRAAAGNGSRRCPSRAAAVARHRPVLQLVDRDSGMRPCRCAHPGRAPITGCDPAGSHVIPNAVRRGDLRPGWLMMRRF